MHDELIYQVDARDASRVAEVVREAMESSVCLKVPTPVAIKLGPTWGSLEDCAPP